jgi:hypothetical protein
MQNDRREANGASTSLQDGVAALLSMGDRYFLPEAVELLKRTRQKPVLSDDEALMLAVTAAQALRAAFMEPERRAMSLIEAMARILDHEDVVRAEFNKLYSIFRETPDQPLSFLTHDHD